MAQGFSSARERNWWLAVGAVLLAIFTSIGWAPLAASWLRNSGLLVPAFVLGVLLVAVAILAAGLRACLAVGGRTMLTGLSARRRKG